MTCISLPTSTGILTTTMLPVHCPFDIRSYPAIAYDKYRDRWIGQFIGLQIVKDRTIRPCVMVCFSDDTRCVLLDDNRVLCKTNESGRLYSMRASCLKPGMRCVTPKIVRSPRYVESVHLVEDGLVRHYYPECTDSITVASGIVVCS